MKIKFPTIGLVGISGQPGAGKSVILRNIAYNFMKSGKKVLFCITEPLSKKLQEKLFPKGLKTLVLWGIKLEQKGNVVKENKLTQMFDKYDVIIIDSISALLPEYVARREIVPIHTYIHDREKLMICSVQVRDNQTAGGQGVEHHLDVLYNVFSLTFTPKFRDYMPIQEKYADEIKDGDIIRGFKQAFDKTFQAYDPRTHYFIIKSPYMIKFLEL